MGRGEGVKDHTIRYVVSPKMTSCIGQIIFSGINSNNVVDVYVT